VDADQLTATHSTALIIAAYNGRLETAKALLEHGVDTEVRDDAGKTALDWAIAQGHPDVAAAIKTAAGGED
jgi:ankyrin repeat protein